MALEPWPPGDKPAPFEKVVDGLVRLLKNSFELREKVAADEDIAYDGFEGTRINAASASPASEHATAELRAYHAERGRDLATVIMMMAVWVGMEQGRRCEIERIERWEGILRMQIKLMACSGANEKQDWLTEANKSLDYIFGKDGDGDGDDGSPAPA